jgi:hypothetical protein
MNNQKNINILMKNFLYSEYVEDAFPKILKDHISIQDTGCCKVDELRIM